MFARCARMRPCLERFWRESSARRTCSLSASVLTEMPSGSGFDSSPLGPLTLIAPAFCEIDTPLGSGNTLRPMRDILPNLAEELAAEPLFAGRAVGHEALRRRQDGDAQARTHLGDRPVSDVHPLPRARTPAQAGDRVGARIGPAKANDDLGSAGDGLGVAHVVTRDVPLVLEQLTQTLFELRRRRKHVSVARQDSVPNPGQEVRNWIGHRHSITYQLDLMTPGMSPRNARFRKQIRHMSNLRRNARARPQLWHRLR